MRRRSEGGRLPLRPPRAVPLAIAAFAVTALVLLAPAALRPLAPRTWVDLGPAPSAESLAALDTASHATSALAAWMNEVGVLSLGIAAFGAAAALSAKRTRPLAGALVTLVVLDALLPARAAGLLSADPLTSLRSLALAAVALASAHGVFRAVAVLNRMAVPMARSAAVLLVVFHLTLVALTSEEAGFAADRSAQVAAEEWTDVAFGRLEPGAAVLVRSPALAWRLWAARVTRGERPDVLVVPLPLLKRGRVAASLLAADRALEPLMSDVALTGEPGEFALSKLADARALHVELDRTWSKRLLSHLLLDGAWLEYAPQPLGPSDRKLAMAPALTPLRRAFSTLAAASVPDPSTATVLADTLRAHAGVLELLGERETAQTYQDRLATLVPRDALAPSPAIQVALAEVLKLVTPEATPPPSARR